MPSTLPGSALLHGALHTLIAEHTHRLQLFPPTATKTLRKFTSGEGARLIGVNDGYLRHLSPHGYRSRENVPTLINAVCAAVAKPAFVAGSINTPEQITLVKKAGAAGFTISAADLDGQHPAENKDITCQLAAIVRDLAALDQHSLPFSKETSPGMAGKRASQ